MSVIVESGIEIDFTPAVSVVKHDLLNSVWPGVDYIIDDGAQEIWLEIKNWEPTGMSAKRRGGQRWSFLCKMRSKTFFREELRGKFLGTTSFLCYTGTPPIRPVLYVVLLESPRFDPVLMPHVNDRMRGLLRPHVAWRPPIAVAVLNVSEWNSRFPHYPARTL